MNFQILGLLTLLSSLALTQPTPKTPYQVCIDAITNRMEHSGMDQNEVWTTDQFTGLGDCKGCEFWATVQALPEYAAGEHEKAQITHDEKKAKCEYDEAHPQPEPGVVVVRVL